MTRTGPASIDQQAVSHVAHMEEDLAGLERELEHMNRLATLGTFSALSAHEINNILTAALGYAQLARSRSSETEYLDKVVDRLETAARIVRAMVDFAGPSEPTPIADGDHGIEPRADVEAALDGALDCLGRDPARDGITLARQIAIGAVPCIQPLALQQILLNLLINARSALRGRGGQVTVSAMHLPTGRISICVADDGPGIPPEVAESLFDPFVTRQAADEAAEPDEAVVAGGSGLGLTVCRRLAESAGGSIAAANKPGGGASFTLELPAASESPQRKAS